MPRKMTKRIGGAILGLINFNLPRRLNGRAVTVPVRCGIKAGISSEKWMSQLLRKIFPLSSDSFLDIGVNLGQTLVKVKTLDPARNYIGIEPNPSCLHYLQHLIRVNGWTNTVIVPTGLYTENCLLKLAGSNDTDGSSTVISEFQSNSDDSRATSRLVPLFTYDTVQRFLPDRRIATIKIDVEGGELEVLTALQELVRRDRPFIIIEVWKNEGDPVKTERTRKLIELIDSLKYSSYSWDITPDRSGYLNFRPATPGEHEATDNFLLTPNERCTEAERLFQA